MKTSKILSGTENCVVRPAVMNVVGVVRGCTWGVTRAQRTAAERGRRPEPKSSIDHWSRIARNKHRRVHPFPCPTGYHLFVASKHPPLTRDTVIVMLSRRNSRKRTFDGWGVRAGRDDTIYPPPGPTTITYLAVKYIYIFFLENFRCKSEQSGLLSR